MWNINKKKVKTKEQNEKKVVEKKKQKKTKKIYGLINKLEP